MLHQKNIFTRTASLLIFLIPITINSVPTIYITPGEFGELFALHDPRFSRDNCLLPLCEMRTEMRAHGYDVKQTNIIKDLPDLHYLIVFDQLDTKERKNLDTIAYEKRILFLWEPPTTKPENYDPTYHALFSKIFTWQDDLVDNKKYFKFYYPLPNLNMIPEIIPFEVKKFSVMIAKNKWSAHPNELYTSRQNVIQFFENHTIELFDLYGVGWNCLNLATFKGAVTIKTECLKWYRFCFCFENMKDINGYVTEKMFDCFIAGCIPIYWGARNITDYVPPDIFIDYRNFNNLNELVAYLWTIDRLQYTQMIEKIRVYLTSKMAAYFSTHHFKQLFVSYFAR